MNMFKLIKFVLNPSRRTYGAPQDERVISAHGEEVASQPSRTIESQFYCSFVMHGFLFLLFALNLPTFGMNLLLRPYDTLVRPEFYSQKTFEVTGWAETGIGHAIGFNDESQVNVLKIWNCTQDALAMLNGFPADSEIGQLRIALDAADDGVRGHFAVNGDLDLRYGAAFGARWQFYPRLWLVSYLPFYALRLHNVSWRDLTQDATAADMRVKEMLTNDIFAKVNELGDGLDLTGWSRAGLGDLNMFLEWLSHHPQNRPLLKDVALNGRVGFTFPTGVKVHPDDIFSIPFGADGALGMLFGGGLWVTFSDCFQAGLDVQLWHLFGNTRCRRIKTSLDQSELLLLAKTSVYKDFGLMQRFNLFAQAYHFAGGLSALLGYQFLKKGEDSLALDTCEFSSRIANSAASLEEWTAHSFIVNLHYDFNVHRDECAIWPQISLFARLPFNGKRAALFKTVGAYFSIDF